MAGLALLGFSGIAQAENAKYVFLMLADGAGYNTWLATSMYQGKVGKQYYDGPGWVHVAAAPEMLRHRPPPVVSKAQAMAQLAGAVYDPERAWDPTPTLTQDDGFPHYFRGYEYLRHAPDSACTTTALVTGVKTFKGAVNVDGRGTGIRDSLARIADREERRVGVVTSVFFSDASPAALAGVRNVGRRMACAMALEMFSLPYLHVIGGAGHPDYDNNGKRISNPQLKSYENVGDILTWAHLTGSTKLTTGDRICRGEGRRRVITPNEIKALDQWALAETLQSIEALAEGPAPERLLMVPRVGQTMHWDGDSAKESVGGTLQQQRGTLTHSRYTHPGDDPRVATVPTLATMTNAAINVLDAAPEGFFLAVEGGGIDWAMHDRQMGRVVEEMMEFHDAVESVIGWIEAGPGWDDALLVVTADHDHLLWGPFSHEKPFDPLVDRGAGKLPQYRWLADEHSRLPVPVYAKGFGADTLKGLADGIDPVYGMYVEQTDVFEVLRQALTDEPRR